MRFGELEILRVLGVGGFGIVYLARDHALERDVALKEYMPASLASRGEGAQVSVRSGGFAETYAVGLRSFVNEARLLAKFDHPSLVKVYRFWEANGTAYMVMPYLQGRTLRDARKALGKAPDEAWLRNVLDPILGALEVLHREGVFHRDIAPDNIWLQNDGPAILLDFGAARRVISDRTQSLTAILKPSYAPIEQYAEMSALRQGPWTDIYALGAVTHFLLTGAPPGPSTARALQDEMVPLWMRHFPGVSPRFLAAVDWALQVRPKERPQGVEELRAALDGRIEPPAVERHDNVHTASAPAPLAADAATEFEPTRRVAGPGVSTTFEPTMRVAPPRPAPTQARPVAAVPPSAVTAAAR
ncbi:MAG: serine/threonine protein kinase, partial [Piscinibacter sp.]|nr:serine/threonine protein kinase [Piscinibacter sp.]